MRTPALITLTISTTAFYALIWSFGFRLAAFAWREAVDALDEWRDTAEDTGAELPSFVEDSPVPLTQSWATGEWAEHDPTLEGLSGIQGEVLEEDTVERFAERHGLSVQALSAHNDIIPRRPLAEGDLLYLVPVHADAYWVIRPGQTVSQIGAVVGVSVAWLAEVNELSDPNHVEPGQVLLLRRPEGCSC